MSRKAHWERVYSTKTSEEVSWFEATPAVSVALLERAGLHQHSRVIDIGGGDSTLVDALLARGVRHVSVLDLSEAALRRAHHRLGEPARNAIWVAADVTQLPLKSGAFDLWHDRAVFHFLTDASDRDRYVSSAAECIRPGGHLAVATFAHDGPSRCSGLDVCRYDAEALHAVFERRFDRVECFPHIHQTPWGADQRFTFCLFRRRANA